MTDLVVDFCDYKAAKWAVEHWHYSKKMPRSKMNTIGAWGNGEFIGAIIFGYGATPQIGSPYGLTQFEIVELTRVAFTKHNQQMSKYLNIAIALLKRHNENLRMIVSFADTEQNHIGVIYQASNFIYAGTTKPSRVGFIVRGEKVHTRTIGLKRNGIQSLDWVQKNLDKRATEWIGTEKHRYLYPLDKKMRRQLLPLAQPYPKKETMRPVNGDNLATSQAGRFDSDPDALTNLVMQDKSR